MRQIQKERIIITIYTNKCMVKSKQKSAMKTKWGHKFADLYKDRTNPSLPFNKEEWEEDAMQYYNWNAEWLKMPTQTREDLEKNYNKYEAKRGEILRQRDEIIQNNKATQALNDSIAMYLKAKQLNPDISPDPMLKTTGFSRIVKKPSPASKAANAPPPTGGPPPVSPILLAPYNYYAELRRRLQPRKRRGRRFF